MAAKHLLITLNYPPTMGGIADYLLRTRKKYFKHMDVIAAAKDAPRGPADIHYLNFDPPASPRHFFRLFIKSFQLLRANRYEGVHFGCVSSGLLCGLLLRFFFSFRITVFVYAMEVIPPRGRLWTRLRLRFLLNRMDHIFVISEFTRAIVQKHFSPDPAKLIMVRPVISPESLQGLVTRPPARHGGLTVLTLCRLVKRKGVDYLLRAFARIHDHHKNVRLIIAGDGPERAALKALAAALKIKKQVRFTGAVTEKEKARLMAGCDLFAMPNRQLGETDIEGFGIVFLEANLFSKPVIGGRSGGTPDAVAHKRSGWLVNPDSIDDIANALNRMLADPAYRRYLGEQGHRRVMRQFNADRYSQRLEKALFPSD